MLCLSTKVQSGKTKEGQPYWFQKCWFQLPGGDVIMVTNRDAENLLAAGDEVSLVPELRYEDGKERLVYSLPLKI